MKKRIKKGKHDNRSSTFNAAAFVSCDDNFVFVFYVHNKVWLTAAAYEAALDGSLETARPEGKSRDKALKKEKNLETLDFMKAKT